MANSWNLTVTQYSSLERTLATIRHQIPDRVPVALHNFLVTIAYANLPLGEALQSGEMLAEAQLKFWKGFRLGPVHSRYDDWRTK